MAEAPEWEPMYGVLKQYGADFAERYKVQAMVKGSLVASSVVDMQGLQFHQWVFEQLRLLDPALAEDFSFRYDFTTQMLEKNQKALEARRAADGARALELERGSDADLPFQPDGNPETDAGQEGSAGEEALDFEEIGPPAEKSSVSGFSAHESPSVEESSLSICTSERLSAGSETESDDCARKTRAPPLPGKWLTETVPKPSSYFPQIGDVVYYFADTHKMAVERLEGQNRFARLIKDLPFKGKKASGYSIADVEILELRDVRFQIAQPDEVRVVRVEAERLTPGLPKDCDKMIVLGFHENIGDILMLKQQLDRSLWGTLKPGQRVKNFYDEGAGLKWGKGTVQSVKYDYSPLGRMCMPRVKWDSDAPGERTFRYRCTDIFPLSPDEEEEVIDGAGVTDEEWREFAYVSMEEDWGGEPAAEQKRVLALLKYIQKFPEAVPLMTPCNPEPDSPSLPYVVDFHTIGLRLENGFYRRKLALEFDLEMMQEVYEKMHGPRHTVVRDARIVVNTCCAVMCDVNVKTHADVDALYSHWKEKWTRSLKKENHGRKPETRTKHPVRTGSTNKETVSTRRIPKRENRRNDSEEPVEASHRKKLRKTV